MSTREPDTCSDNGKCAETQYGASKTTWRAKRTVMTTTAKNLNVTTAIRARGSEVRVCVGGLSQVLQWLGAVTAARVFEEALLVAKPIQQQGRCGAFEQIVQQIAENNDRHGAGLRKNRR